MNTSMISMLDRKLLRDLWRLRGMVMVIVLVMASGIATYVMPRTALDLLTPIRDAYHDHDRSDQTWAKDLESEITRLRTMAIFGPAIFLSVAAFLLHVVMSRLVATQREQIGSLKARGYSNLDVSLHFVKFFLVIAIGGGIMGGVAGIWLGFQITEHYTRALRLPVLMTSLSPTIIAEGTFFCVAASLSGALGAVRTAATLPPAEAMRPPAPPV